MYNYENKRICCQYYKTVVMCFDLRRINADTLIRSR